MKKILYVVVLSVTVVSCGADKNDKEHITEVEEHIDVINLDQLSEEELKTQMINLEALLVDSVTNETSKPNAIKMLEASNKFAERFPESASRESMMYKGALAARGLEKYFEAVRILNKLCLDYPNSVRYPDYAYEKAHIYDDILGNKEKAKKIYTELAENYPDHQFGKDSKARLVLIDMTDEELMQYFSNQDGK